LHCAGAKPGIRLDAGTDLFQSPALGFVGFAQLNTNHIVHVVADFPGSASNLCVGKGGGMQQC